MSDSDSSFFKTFAMVLVALLAFFTFIVSVAMMLDLDRSNKDDKAKVQLERIAPVGQVVTSADQLTEAPKAAPAEPLTGEAAYTQACAACHAAGIAGAPKFGDAAEWEKRISAGLDGLVSSVINGKGSMPARGGSALSDDEIRSAVEYMIGQ